MADFTTREEANALICFAVRNGYIEELHAQSKISDAEMKQLMIEASESLAKILKLKETNAAEYWRVIEHYCKTYTSRWVKEEPPALKFKWFKDEPP